jgi:hypothetical protein
MMGGWKTWLAAACTAGLGVVSIYSGDQEAGLQQIAAALAMVGLGHKIEKLNIFDK